MGRFHIYAHDKIDKAIFLEKVESENFITSTSVTLSHSRHIFWEIMFGNELGGYKYYKQNIDPNILDRVYVTTFEEAIKCLDTIQKVNHPFVQSFHNRDEFNALVERFKFHVINRLNKKYLLYNISEVFGSYDVAKTEIEVNTALSVSQAFYFKILHKEVYNFREALYALAGTPFTLNLAIGNQITFDAKNPVAEDYYNAVAGVEDM